MKRQTFMKSTLCLLMALVCNVAWAQPAISDAPANGEWAQKTTWFRIETGDDYSYRADDLTATGYLALTNKVDAKSDVALWCIVGDAEKGYHFYNRAKGAAVVLGMKDGYAEFVAAGTSGYITAFDFVQSQKTGNTYWCAKEHGSANNFLNRKNNGDYHLQFWNSSAASGTDNGSAMLFTEVDLSTLTELYATESDITATQELIKDAPGYPKRTSAQYRMLNEMLKIGQGIIKTDLDAAVLAYKTCTDIILPEDGKAYTFTAVMSDAANATRYYMKYENGKKVTVSTTSTDASVFVCKELSTTNANEKKYAFITADCNVLTWIGNNDGNAYKENNNIYGYSSNYAAEYNGLLDWNDITVKKNGTEAKDFGYLRLVARRNSSGTSSIIANSGGRFDQASDGYWFNGTNSSSWVLTEVEHANTAEQEWALAKIDAKLQIKDMKLGSYYLVDKSSNKLTNLKTAFDAVNAAKSQDEIDALLASRALSLPVQGKAYYLKDNHGTYVDIHHLGKENASSSYDQLATLSKTKQLLYITGDETDGTWKIHTTAEGGNYLFQHPSANRWNSWVSDAGSSFKWDVEGVDISGTPHYMLKNISGVQNGYLGGDASHPAGNPLFVNQTEHAKKLKMQLLPVKSITGLAPTAAEWLDTESVAVTEIPTGITALGSFTTANTSGEYFYINAGRLTGLFKWRSGSGSQKVNIVGVEVVGLDGAVKDADYHVGATGTSHSKNTYVVDVPEDGLYYLRYYTETNTNVHNSDVDITYTLIEKNVDSVEEFVEGGIYTFITKRGWMGAHQDYTTVISTKKITNNDPAPSDENPNFQWTMYKSSKGNYYLYNIGKEQFMGVESSNNTSVPFTATPSGKDLTFKVSNTADYPIMFSTDNKGVVNHTGSYGNGLVTWTGGWDVLNDEGSNHKVTLVGMMEQSKLNTLKELVERFDQQLPVNYQVEMSENNPNTHFGSVKATSSIGTFTTKLKKNTGVVMLDYDGINETTIDFTRDYRGFEFQGYSHGGVDLGKSFTLTADLKSSITEENPLVAKFDTTEAVTLFYDDDPFSYRIPAIGKTSTGRLIAVSDYRYSLDDIGRYNFGTANPGIDLVMRYSDDNGKTWSETKTIAKGSCVRGTDDCAYGDAAIAVVGQKVLVMGAAGDVMFGNGSATAHNRAIRIFSEDNGVTWTKQDISETLFLGDDATIKNGYSSFFGSGRLAVDENYNGTGKARIYGALLLKKASGTGNYVIYTDDLGLTWHILGGSQDPVAAQDEPKVEILPSGQILLSVRRGGGRQFNVFTYTDKATNAGSWDSNENGCSNGGSNTCNGEPFLVDAKKADGTAVKLLLQSQPKGGSGLYDRRDVTIWYKEVTDANYTSAQIAADWVQGLQVSTQQSAYSAMALQDDGKIAFFFEEAPCYGDDQAKGYCMVYTPLTIEGITKGNYFSPNADLNATQTINVVLTDVQGNEYRDQVQSGLTGVAAALATKYPFITMGDTPNLESDGETFTYTNTVTLPFKVSGEEEIWHNIYFMSNKINNVNYPVYLSASAANNEFVTTSKDGVAGSYGDNSWNTLENADKINWAVYNVGNGFTFKFKNKLTGKFIQVTNVASGNAQNVKYVDEADATAFELVPSSNNFYAVKAPVSGTDGYLCCTSASYGYATHFDRYNHAGGTMTFTEAPDFAALIAEVNATLGMIGTSLGQYKATDANAATAETAKEAMGNSNSVKLNDLNTYKNLLTDATLNMPVAGQYFRVAYDYGGNVGKLYMQSTASSVKGLEFTAATGAASIWVYYDGALYSYTAGKNLREHGDDRGLHDTKTTVEFSASSRAKGKYNVKCGSFIHANSGSGSYYSDHCDKDGGHAAHDLILEEVEMNTSLTSIIEYVMGNYEIGTFCANHAVIIPEGIKAYVATATPTQEGDALVLTMTKITDGVIPAQTGVVVRGTPKTYHFEVSQNQGTPVTGNLLQGYAGVFESNQVALTDGYTNYVLAVEKDDEQNDVVGFYKKAVAFKVYNNRAYLKIPQQGGQQAQALRIRFAGEQGGTTEIEGSELKAQGSQLIYDLQGRRVVNPTKGMYIVNGKKVIF